MTTTDNRAEDTAAVQALPARPGRWAWLLLVTPALRWLIARYSVPVEQPWRTSCDTCGAPLTPAGAAWSALSPMGRCGACGEPLGAPAFAVEIAVVSAPQPFVVAAALWWVLCAVPMAFVDLRVHRLPNPLTYAAAGGVFVLLALAAATGGHWSALLSALLSAAVTGVVFLAVALLLGARGMGLGDAKLAVSVAGLAGWWGWGTAFSVILLAFFATRILRHSHSSPAASSASSCSPPGGPPGTASSRSAPRSSLPRWPPSRCWRCSPRSDLQLQQRPRTAEGRAPGALVVRLSCDARRR